MSIFNTDRGPRPTRLDADIEYATNEAERVGQQAMSEAGIEARNLGGEAARLYETINAHVGAAETQSVSAMALAAALADRDVIHQPREDRAFSEKLTAARMEVKARLQAADAGVEVLKNVLLSNTLPRIEDPAKHAEARAEVELLLANAGANLAVKMATLAKGADRRLAAVVVGSWGLAKLAGDAEAHRAVVVQSLTGTLQHGTADEKAHAVAFSRLPVNLGRALAVRGVRARQRAGG